MLEFSPKIKTGQAVKLIKASCKKEKIKNVLIAVSGGVDSATSLTLAVKALGAKHVFPVLLPYGKLSFKGTKDARLIFKKLKISPSQIILVDIKPLSDSIFAYDKKMDDIRKGNIMARIRMIVLYDLYRKNNMLVVGTENKSEHFLGYYTRFGDEASDIEPIRDLYKTQVFQLAKYLKIPTEIITKSPSAGLWEGQTDEEEFGFSYKTADEVLYLHFEKRLSKNQIITKGYNKKIVNKIFWWIEKGKFKTRLPYSPKE